MKPAEQNPSTAELAGKLAKKIQEDTQFAESQQAQITCLIENIVTCLKSYPDTQDKDRAKAIDDASYNTYIALLWANINNNDQLNASTKRMALYAVGELQQCLWRK